MDVVVGKLGETKEGDPFRSIFVLTETCSSHDFAHFSIKRVICPFKL